MATLRPDHRRLIELLAEITVEDVLSRSEGSARNCSGQLGDAGSYADINQSGSDPCISSKYTRHGQGDAG
jgi:hypothetical protein